MEQMQQETLEEHHEEQDFVREHPDTFFTKIKDALAPFPLAKALPVLVILLLVGGIGITVLAGQHQQNTASHADTPTPTPTPTLPPIWYQVSGKQILKNGTTPLIPYGMQIGGITMAVVDWRTRSTNDTEAMIAAAQYAWHSNTVSLQLASAPLFDAAPYDSDYIAKVDQIVNWVTQRNMNIILVLQYEATSHLLMPTQDSVNFWDFISKRYANRPRVMFDVFNEPRASLLFNDKDDDTVWNFWQNGGTVNGTTYVGMQQLIDTIRKNTPSTLLFIDGLAAGEDIALLPHHVLTGSNLVYAIHPYLGTAQHGTIAQWDSWFGNAATSGNFPVVADEWSEYQNGNDGECFPTAPQVVPTFLSYLHGKNIGLLGYALFPGTLIRGWNFTNPTQFGPLPYSCPVTSPPNMNPLAQGAGQLLMRYFQQYAVPLGPTPVPPSPTSVPTLTPTLTPVPVTPASGGTPVSIN